MKTIGLIDVDSKYPNLALMKIAAYHKSIGNRVMWYDWFEDFDDVYMSKIFNFTPDYGYVMPNVSGDIIKGGTGYDITSVLPDEIDRIQPDYSLYPTIDDRTSYGFLTRGCPNRCKWCVVPKKEGSIKPYMDIEEITLNGARPYAILMDNNILASDYGLEQIEKIRKRRYHVDFNQALDARLVTPEIAKMLARVKWIGSLVRFGCDTPAQISDCERVMDMMTAAGYRGQWLLYCIIMGDIHECVDRISYWKHSKYRNRVRIAAQPFRDPFVMGEGISKLHTPSPMAAAPRPVGRTKRILHHIRIRRLPLHQRHHRQGLSLTTLPNGKKTSPTGQTNARHGGQPNSPNSPHAPASAAANTYKSLQSKSKRPKPQCFAAPR